MRVFIYITWYKGEPAWTHALEGPHFWKICLWRVLDFWFESVILSVMAISVRMLMLRWRLLEHCNFLRIRFPWNLWILTRIEREKYVKPLVFKTQISNSFRGLWELLKWYNFRFKFVSEVQAKRKLIYMGPVLDFSRWRRLKRPL